MKGMVISKSAVMRKILRGVLYSVDLSEIVLISSGAEGFEAYKADKFDIVLLDSYLSDIGISDLYKSFGTWKPHSNFCLRCRKQQRFCIRNNPCRCDRLHHTSV